jgi:hypothetical protein
MRGDSLYAIGSEADNSVYLFRLDSAASRLAEVNKLGSDPGLVIVDPERSLVVCGFPREPAHLQMVDTRSPSTVRSVDFNYKPEEFLPYGIFEFDVPGEGLYLGFAFGHLWTPIQIWADHLTAVQLDRAGALPETMPISDLSQLLQIRFMGFVGDRFDTPGEQVLFVGENPLRLLFKPSPGASEIPAPSDWNVRMSQGKNNYRLLVGNDELMVLRWGKPSRAAVFDVLDKRSRRWSTVAPLFRRYLCEPLGAGWGS